MNVTDGPKQLEAEQRALEAMAGDPECGSFPSSQIPFLAREIIKLQKQVEILRTDKNILREVIAEALKEKKS